MRAKFLRRVQLMKSVVEHSHTSGRTITIGEALDRCQEFDVKQIAWELAEAKVKVPAAALLAMALSRSVVRQVAEQYACQEQLKQANKLVPRTGDTRAS